MPTTAVHTAGPSAAAPVDQPLAVLVLRDEIDASNSAMLAQVTATVSTRCLAVRSRNFESPGAERLHGNVVVVDASGLRFIDASGLGVLVALHNTLAESHIALRVIDAPRQLRRISAICGLDEVLGLDTVPLAPTDDAALSPPTDRPGAKILPFPLLAGPAAAARRTS